MMKIITDVCLARGSKPFPKPVLRRRRSSGSSFSFQYPLVSSRSSSSCKRLLPRLPVTSILPSVFPSITCCRKQFLSKMWPIQLAFLLFIVCRISLSSLTLCDTSSFSHDQLKLYSPSFSSTTFRNFPFIFDLLSEVSRFQHIYNAALQMWHSTSFFLKFKSNFLVKKSFSCWRLLVSWHQVPTTFWRETLREENFRRSYA